MNTRPRIEAHSAKVRQFGFPEAGGIMFFCDRHRPSLVISGILLITLGTTEAAAQTRVHAEAEASAHIDLPVGQPGPLELLAQPITLENPLPSRLLGGPPVYPGEAVGTGAAGTMVFRLMIDDAGTVAEARYIGHTRYALREVRGRLEAAPMLDSTFLAVTENALRGWLYEAPASAPVAIDVEFAFAGDGRVRLVWQGPADLEVRTAPVEEAADPNAPPLSTSHPDAPTVGTVQPPKRIKGASPRYPPEALAQHIEGTVIVEILIDTTGHVAETRLVRGQPELAPSAIDAVRQWEFTPTLVNGKPMPVILTTTVSFTQQR
jgi:TonB family protein